MKEEKLIIGEKLLLNQKGHWKQSFCGLLHQARGLNWIIMTLNLGECIRHIVDPLM